MFKSSKKIIAASVMFMAMFFLQQAPSAHAEWFKVPTGNACGDLSCTISKSNIEPGESTTVTANIKDGITSEEFRYKVGDSNWTDWSSSNTKTVNFDDYGINQSIRVDAQLGELNYNDAICSVNVCVAEKGDACTYNGSICSGKDLPGTISCTGTCTPTSTVCNTCDPATEDCNTCPLTPEYIKDATYNLFNSDGNFVMTNPATGQIDENLFNEYFAEFFDTSVPSSPVSAYNAGNGELVDIEINNGVITGGFPISGFIDSSCNASLCPLNLNEYDNTDGNNTACALIKTGQELSTNGCYNPLGGTPTGKLLVSPNYMEPGEACSITWCAQGTAIKNCALFVGGTEVGNIKGMGLSGTASFLMPTGDNAKSQTVQLVCDDQSNQTIIQKVDSCKLSPNWTQF